MADQAPVTAEHLAQYFLETRTEKGSSSQGLLAQMRHRLQLVSFWTIAPGSRVLELGCGQGDSTIVLADTVGENGLIDAVDPAPPSYGSPFNLGQAQGFICSGALGSRITFHTADPVDYLLSYSGPTYDDAVMVHCLWYFLSPAILPGIVDALKSKTKYLCIAEWSLRASSPSAQPHVLAALLLANLEAKQDIPGGRNIRTVLSPSMICKAVESTGLFRLVKEETRAVDEGLQDARWEVSDTLKHRDEVVNGLRTQGRDEKEVVAVIAQYDALQSSVDILPQGFKNLKSMDVWVGRFEAI